MLLTKNLEKLIDYIDINFDKVTGDFGYLEMDIANKTYDRYSQLKDSHKYFYATPTFFTGVLQILNMALLDTCSPRAIELLINMNENIKEGLNGN